MVATGQPVQREFCPVPAVPVGAVPTATEMAEFMLKKTSKLLETLSNPRYWSGLRHGIVPSIEHKLALKGLNVRTVLDVGANRGQFSLLARCLYPAATIYAFEPLQRPAERFRALFADQSNVHLFQVGIGEALGETKMFVANDHHASSSILKAHKQSQIFGSRETGEETVRVGRLDDFLRLDRICAPCLLKIDVQGYELQVIKGCREALPLVDYLYVECCYVELYARQALAHEILSRLGLGARLSHKPQHLSRGEQQRVAIARALANKPPLILADEPCASLDAATATEVLEEFLTVCREDGKTLFIVSHDEVVLGAGDQVVDIAEINHPGYRQDAA